MASEDVLDRFDAWRFKMYLSPENERMLAVLAAEVRELRNDRDLLERWLEKCGNTRDGIRKILAEMGATEND